MEQKTNMYEYLYRVTGIKGERKNYPQKVGEKKMKKLDEKNGWRKLIRKDGLVIRRRKQMKRKKKMSEKN